MPDFSALLQNSQENIWVLLASAILLGALHGLEPGHSKTLMAGVIISFQGTVRQAIVLGLATTVSHSLVVWAIALLGLSLGQSWPATTTEPLFQMASGIIIILISFFILFRTKQHCHKHHHQHLSKIDSTKPVSYTQLLIFGFTGGLIPCPAAITVLLLCIQLEQITLGASLVLGFSIGLALTLVAVGVFAALGLSQAEQKWPKLKTFLTQVPYFSGLLILTIGLYMLGQGITHAQFS